MKYTHAIKGSFYAFIVFVFITIAIPGKGPSEDIRTILTVSTFLFAILAGFFLARLNKRYNQIREYVALEDANLLTLYKTSTLSGEKFSNKIRNLLDKYYIISYDYYVAASYKENGAYLFQIYDILKTLPSKFSTVLGALLGQLKKIEENRNNSSALLEEKLTKGQWSILTLLVGIILFCIFSLKTEQIYSHIITILLSTVLILILLVLRDLQNLRLRGGQMIMEESGQEVLEFMGLKRYYNNSYLSEVKLPHDVKEYRIGLHKAGEKFNIVTVKNPKYYK
jgi:hypothetical protein